MSLSTIGEDDVVGLDERTVERFLYREARLADEHCYDEWEALWTDDAIYWVPGEHDHDPATHMSIVYDNRHRIGTRIAQLKSGRRHSQEPKSRLRRTVANVELLGMVGGESVNAADLVIEANFTLIEARHGTQNYWGGRLTYRLRTTANGLLMSYKKVDLVNRLEALPNISFLI